ncbi:hypothetical protein WA026_013588 [Henosepilachna vigintioctopunctata]|uniref:C2H2-type domain-containing protein n=1 Tax=Henosepilachna vigintioctopunctata TaxID=420089 RepID=A0AAW1VEF7_9CUCU
MEKVKLELDDLMDEGMAVVRYIDQENVGFTEDETWLDKHHVIFTSKQHRINGQLKGEKLKCKLCNFNTEDSIQLKAHLKGIHGQFEFQCHICHYSNPLEFCLKRHLSLEHPDKIELKCSLCDYSTYRKSNLRGHVNDVHLKLMNDINYGLKYHEDKTPNRNHHVTSISKQQLINDKLKGDKIKCGFCIYSTENSVQLEQHMKTVHPEFDIMSALDDAENRLAKCLLCNYSSNRKANLRIHLKAVHLKLKNFKCDVCDYRTSHKHSLKLHVNSVHLKVKKYHCQLCDYSTNQTIRFKFHRRSEH